MFERNKLRIAVIGLGYVGLPLAVEFGKKYPTLGFDLNNRRINELRSGLDVTDEVLSEDILGSNNLVFSCDESELDEYNFFVVAVPTPTDQSHRPDLTALISASKIIGRTLLKPRSQPSVVVYESTVYPGATEDDCIPIIEKESGLILNKDFYAGYSPERINPGDKNRPLRSIVKVTSGSTHEAANFIDEIYASIITAGTYKAASIKVAEASKIIENTQRDVNIALINELSIIFSHLNIDTNAVLQAAATKWNFINLKPGLVGGHCIGVDPYYLVDKSTRAGYIPDVIRKAREINDGMALNVCDRLIKAMVVAGINISNARILIAGFTFKENCGDVRNTKVIDLISHIKKYGCIIDVVDSYADSNQVMKQFGVVLHKAPPSSGCYSAVILTVPHKEFIELGSSYFKSLLIPSGLFFDMKSVFPIEDSDVRL